MQNYLISHVLFDGKEDVQAVGRPESSERLIGVQEEAGEDDCEGEDGAENPEDGDAMFEAYKREMEKYLSVVCQEAKGARKKKKSSKKAQAHRLFENPSARVPIIQGLTAIPKKYPTPF